MRPYRVEDWRGDIGVGLSAFRHFGTPSPNADVPLPAGLGGTARPWTGVSPRVLRGNAR